MNLFRSNLYKNLRTFKWIISLPACTYPTLILKQGRYILNLSIPTLSHASYLPLHQKGLVFLDPHLSHHLIFPIFINQKHRLKSDHANKPGKGLVLLHFSRTIWNRGKSLANKWYINMHQLKTFLMADLTANIISIS